jgi:hypothetical protein
VWACVTGQRWQQGSRGGLPTCFEQKAFNLLTLGAAFAQNLGSAPRILSSDSRVSTERAGPDDRGGREHEVGIYVAPGAVVAPQMGYARTRWPPAKS